MVDPISRRRAGGGVIMGFQDTRIEGSSTKVPEGFIAVRVDKVFVHNIPLPYPNPTRKPPHIELGHALGFVTLWNEKRLKLKSKR